MMNMLTLFIALILTFVPVQQRGFECQRYTFDGGQWRCSDHLASPNWVDLNDEVGGGPGLGFPAGQPFGLSNTGGTTAVQRAATEYSTYYREARYYLGRTFRGAAQAEKSLRQNGFFDIQRVRDSAGKCWVVGCSTRARVR